MKRLTDYHAKKHPKIQPSTDVSRDMTFFTTLTSAPSQYFKVPLAPSRKRSQLLNPKCDDVDDFLSSDLELSFASTMSLNSPPRDTMSLAQDQDVSMDISPAPRHAQKENERMNRTTTRPRASTSAARIFGHDISNDESCRESTAGTGSQNLKRTQRGALPMEWKTNSNHLKTMDKNMFTPASAHFNFD